MVQVFPSLTVPAASTAGGRHGITRAGGGQRDSTRENIDAHPPLGGSNHVRKQDQLEQLSPPIASCSHILRRHMSGPSAPPLYARCPNNVQITPQQGPMLDAGQVHRHVSNGPYTCQTGNYDSAQPVFSSISSLGKLRIHTFA